MAYEAITLETTAEKLAVLTLNRPESLNALNKTMLEEILHAVNSLSKDEKARALLITGAGRAFSSGADLQPTSPASMDGFDFGQALRDHYNPIMLALADLKMPIVTAVNGPAAGAGMSIALAGDIIIASKSAYFLQAFVNIGLVPDAGSSYILPKLIGPARARALMMMGGKLPAETALDWGMVYEVVDDDKLADHSLDLATKLANGPTVALGNIRRLIQNSENNSFSEQLALEAELQSATGKSEDTLEGISAFITKRKAKFAGR